VLQYSVRRDGDFKAEVYRPGVDIGQVVDYATREAAERAAEEVDAREREWIASRRASVYRVTRPALSLTAVSSHLHPPRGPARAMTCSTWWGAC
jgi:hypothetical protein